MKSATLRTLCASLLIMLLIPVSVLADNGHQDEHKYDQKNGWGHGDIRYFPKYDAKIWYGGHWYHGGYQGRYGWWWVVAGVWYFYTVPVYPYPNPYVPSVVVVNPPPPTIPAAPPTPAVANYWYYCKAANAYYPYVSACPGGWQQVPATPPPPEPPASSQIPPPPPG